jgi:hypothetical protein
MDHYPERLPLAGMPGPGCRVRTQPPAAGEQRAQLRRCAAAVLHQAADEEQLLFSAHDAPPGFARLSRGPRAPGRIIILLAAIGHYLRIAGMI